MRIYHRALVLALLLSGCASAGTKIDPQQAAAFQRGEATYADVTGKLGRPTSETVSSDGSRFVSYSWTHTAARPETFIPIVGAFVGGADTRSQVFMFHFGPDLKLIGTSNSNTTVGASTGLAAGS
jgi:hypothetical protein